MLVCVLLFTRIPPLFTQLRLCMLIALLLHLPSIVSLCLSACAEPVGEPGHDWVPYTHATPCNCAE